MEEAIIKMQDKLPEKKGLFSKNSYLPSKLCFNSDVFGLKAFGAASDLIANAGDLIQIDRVLYTEWALYAGDGNIVHIAGFESDSEIPTDMCVVKLSSVEDVAGVCSVRVNNKIVGAKERSLEPLPAEQALQNAYALLDKVVEFNLLTRNSEHYVTEWKYGHGWSDQAAVTMNVMKALSTDCSAGHSVLLNSLNAIFSSPGSPVGQSPPYFMSTVSDTGKNQN